MPIIVSGTVEEVERKLIAALAVITFKKWFGWYLFQDDEVWNYETHKDERVCPVCWAFERQWIGSELQTEFTMMKRRTAQNEVYPNTHETQDYSFLSGECRCNLIWRDYLEVLTRRLFEEIEAEING